MDYSTEREGTASDDVFDNTVNPVFMTFGRAGNDSYITAEFANFLGGPGNDTISGGSAGATAAYWDSPAGITVDLVAGYAEDGWGTRDRLHGVTVVQATGYADTLLGDDHSNEFWPAAGSDVIDGRGGVDLLTLGNRPENIRWSRSGSDWQYQWLDANGSSMGISTVRNVEMVRYYFDNHFTDAQVLRGDATSPATVTYNPQSPQLDQTLLSDTAWRIGQFGDQLAYRRISETSPVYYYPTSADYHPSGIFFVNPHNAVAGDFNGDGREDLWINWVAFPHTVEHTTAQPPTLLLNTGSGLSPLATSAIPASINRHMAYRLIAADFTGDGVDDVAFGGMGIITRLADGGYANTWERNGLITFGGGQVADLTDQLEGQGPTADLSDWGFAHDGSAGDVNGDGRADLYAGGRLWVSAASNTWLLATDSLPNDVPRNPPMSTAIGDLNGDSRDDIVAFWPDFSNAAYAILSTGDAYPGMTAVRLPAPLFPDNSKNNYCAIGDINADGLGDIIVTTTRSSPYYQGAAIQILIQTAPGQFADETAQRVDNSPTIDITGAGEGQLRLLDVNGDGLLDIVHSADYIGANIFLNDGTGHFHRFDITSMPIVQSYQIEGLQSFAIHAGTDLRKIYPMQIDDDGLCDFLGYVTVGTYQSAGENAAALYTMLSSEQAWGRDAAESLSGTRLADHIRGYSGNDTISGGAGNDTLDGGSGFDIASFSGNLSAYTLTHTGSTYTVHSKNGTDGTDTLTNIESVTFADKTVNLSIQALAAAAPQADVTRLTELYVAFFNRVPDADGLAFWISQMGAGQGINQIAENFYSAGVANSATTGYTSDMADIDFVKLIYKNVLGRTDTFNPPEPEALTFWTEGLTSKSQTHGSLVDTILTSAHTFKGNATWGWVADLLDNKITVAKTFAVDWGLNYNTPDDSISHGMAIAAAVTSTGTTDAIALIGVSASEMHLG